MVGVMVWEDAISGGGHLNLCFQQVRCKRWDNSYLQWCADKCSTVGSLERKKSPFFFLFTFTDFHAINTPTIRNNLKQPIWEYAELGIDANNIPLWTGMSWLQHTTRFLPKRTWGLSGRTEGGRDPPWEKSKKCI